MNGFNYQEAVKRVTDGELPTYHCFGKRLNLQHLLKTTEDEIAFKKFFSTKDKSPQLLNRFNEVINKGEEYHPFIDVDIKDSDDPIELIQLKLFLQRLCDILGDSTSYFETKDPFRINLTIVKRVDQQKGYRRLHLVFSNVLLERGSTNDGYFTDFVKGAIKEVFHDRKIFEYVDDTQSLRMPFQLKPNSTNYYMPFLTYTCNASGEIEKLDGEIFDCLIRRYIVQSETYSIYGVYDEDVEYTTSNDKIVTSNFTQEFKEQEDYYNGYLFENFTNKLSHKALLYHLRRLIQDDIDKQTIGYEEAQSLICSRVNAEFAFLVDEDVVILYSKKEGNTELKNIKRIPRSNFIALYFGRVFVNGPADPSSMRKKKTQKHDIFRVWFKNINRREYESFVFNPSSLDRVIKSEINTYAGLKYSMKELRVAYESVKNEICPETGLFGEKCSVIDFIDKHIRIIICANDPKSYHYFMKMLSCKARYPDRKLKSMLVLKGKEGAGKSCIINFFGRLFGRYFTRVQDLIKTITRFSGQISNKLVVFVDEGYYPGKTSTVGVLKQMITEESVTIEKKYKDAKEEQNHILWIMSSNDEWCVPTTGHSRRYAIYKCLHPKYIYDNWGKKKNRLYFEIIWKLQEDELYLKAWLYTLFMEEKYSTEELLKWDGTEIPLVLKEDISTQQIHAMTAVQAFWKICLERGFVIPPEIDLFSPYHVTAESEKQQLNTLLTISDIGRREGPDYRFIYERNSVMIRRIRFNNIWLETIVKNQIFIEFTLMHKKEKLTPKRETITREKFWMETYSIFDPVIQRRNRVSVTQKQLAGANTYYETIYNIKGNVFQISSASCRLELVQLGSLADMISKYQYETRIPINYDRSLVKIQNQFEESDSEEHVEVMNFDSLDNYNGLPLTPDISV